MRQIAALLVVGSLSLTLTWPSVALADASPEQIQFAAQEHDLGYRAYTAKHYEEAANHFENAFFAAENAAELRSAIRARHEAGQAARAATLSAIGQRKFPNDAALGKLADQTISAARAAIFEVDVRSPEECSATVDEKVVDAEKVKAFRFFVDPGKHALDVAWSNDRATHVDLDAKAGSSKALDLTPPPPPPKPVVVAPAPAAPEGPPPSRKPFGPAIFFTWAGLTVVGAGATIWSGLDAESHPGTNAVKTGCVGQGTNCPLYQQGLQAQLRTNVLLAATGGAAVVTAVIGLFLTHWSHAEASPPSQPPTGLTVTPVLGLGEAALLGAF
jgi:hypothetical protein